MTKILACTALAVAALIAASVGLAARAGDKQDEASRDRVLLETIGTLGAAHLHETYLNIGFVADGKAEGTYEAKDAKEILRTVLALRETVDKQLERVGKLQLDAADRKSLNKLRALSSLLAEQGKELQAFWDTGKKERGTKYEKIRQQAWEEIQNLTRAEATDK